MLKIVYFSVSPPLRKVFQGEKLEGRAVNSVKYYNCLEILNLETVKIFVFK